MKKAKKRKTHVVIPISDLKKLTKEITDVAVRDSFLIYTAAMKDVLKLNGDQCERVLAEANLYAEHWDKRRLDALDFAETIDRDLGFNTTFHEDLSSPKKGFDFNSFIKKYKTE